MLPPLLPCPHLACCEVSSSQSHVLWMPCGTYASELSWRSLPPMPMPMGTLIALSRYVASPPCLWAPACGQSSVTSSAGEASVLLPHSPQASGPILAASTAEVGSGSSTALWTAAELEYCDPFSVSVQARMQQSEQVSGVPFLPLGLSSR